MQSNNLEYVSSLMPKLASEHANFEIVLKNLSVGIAFFDDDQSLLLSNPKYFDLFGIPSHLSFKAKNLKDIINLRIHSGYFPDVDPAEFMQQTIGAHADDVAKTVDTVFPNGKVISCRYIPFENRCCLTLIEDITELHEARQHLERMAFQDMLTGLKNRRYLEDYFELFMETDNPSGSLLFLDLDGFKQVNDVFGHHAGDELLQQFAERMTSCIRHSDTAVRFGGDEFAIFLPDGDPFFAVKLAKRIINNGQKEFLIGDDPVYVGTSIGIAFCGPETKSLDQMIAEADKAMYDAKQSGKNKYNIAKA
ncbi:MAG: diguanylate cyclase [Pseudomonadota bacterium]